jgi:uncharacterized protein YjbI with pentapeptide repeats
MQKATITDTLFSECDLSDARITDSMLIGSDFTSSKFKNTTLVKVNLTKTSLTATELDTVTVHNCNLTNADFLEANITDSNFSNCGFTGSNFNQTKISNTDFIDGYFVGSEFIEATIKECQFPGSNFYGVEFTNCILTNVSFNGANLTNANFMDSNLVNVTFDDAITDGIMLPHDYSINGSDSINNLISTADSAQLDSVHIDESKIPSVCNDLVMLEDLDINNEMADNPDFFILVFPSDKEDFKVICKTREEIKLSVKDVNSIFYECTGRFKRDTLPDGTVVELRDKVIGPINETPYVKIHGVGGAQVYIDIKQVKTLLNSTERVYYVYPVKEITHSISWNNKFNPAPSYISSNHCQDRSNISVYTLKVCEGDCILSNKFR